MFLSQQQKNKTMMNKDKVIYLPCACEGVEVRRWCEGVGSLLLSYGTRGIWICLLDLGEVLLPTELPYHAGPKRYSVKYFVFLVLRLVRTWDLTHGMHALYHSAMVLSSDFLNIKCLSSKEYKSTSHTLPSLGISGLILSHQKWPLPLAETLWELLLRWRHWWKGSQSCHTFLLQCGARHYSGWQQQGRPRGRMKSSCAHG